MEGGDPGVRGALDRRQVHRYCRHKHMAWGHSHVDQTLRGADRRQASM